MSTADPVFGGAPKTGSVSGADPVFGDPRLGQGPAPAWGHQKQGLFLKQTLFLVTPGWDRVLNQPDPSLGQAQDSSAEPSTRAQRPALEFIGVSLTTTLVCFEGQPQNQEPKAK